MATAGQFFAILSPTSQSVDVNPHGVGAGDTGELRFLELIASGSNFSSFKSADAMTSNADYTWPDALPTVSGQALTATTAGVMSWVAAGGTDLSGLGVDNRIARWDGDSTLQSSPVTINDVEQMVFEGGGANDPIFDWSTNNRLDFLLGSTLQFSITDGAMTFDNGTTDTGISWANNGLLEFQLQSATEMTMSSSSLVFNNGATTTGINWGSDGRLAFLIGASVEVRIVSGSMTFEAGVNDPGLDWGTDGQLDLTITGNSVVHIDASSMVVEENIELRFLEDSGNGTNYVGFLAPDAILANVIWTLPDADATISGQVLSSDAAGVLSWVAAGSGTDLTGLGVDNRIARWNGTDTIQSSSIEINDSNVLTFQNPTTTTGIDYNTAARMAFQIAGADELILEANTLTLRQDGASDPLFDWSTLDRVDFQIAGVVNVRNTALAVTVNPSFGNIDFLVGDDVATLFACDAGVRRVQIGGTGFGAKFEIQTLSADGVACMLLDQDDIDEPFIAFEGTSAADTNNNLTTFTTGNTVQGHFLVNINGVDRWIQFYDPPTS